MEPLVPTRRHNGWTADRQRRFLKTLATTSSVTRAATRAFMTARSAYCLRARPEGGASARRRWRRLRLLSHREPRRLSRPGMVRVAGVLPIGLAADLAAKGIETRHLDTPLRPSGSSST